MTWFRSSLLLGSLASTACANIFGVGELTAGAADAGGAGAAGSERTASAGSGAQAAFANGGAVFAADDGGATFTFLGSGGSTITIGNAGTAAVSGTAATSPATGAGGSGSGALGQPPSCADLPAVCGSLESASRDCCASLEVPAGSFFRSYDALPGGGWDDPASPASISAFRLDAYEVTVGRFRRFVAAYPWQPASGAGQNPGNALDFGWNASWNAFLPRDARALSDALESCGAEGAAELPPSTWSVVPDASELLPINCLTWFEAFAFCAWDGGRLPSEAEWNYAAAGGAQARIYPWASRLPTEVDASYAVYQAPIAKVGSKSLGNGLFGQADLAGNVWEWNVDWYRPTYSVPCDDCAELSADVDISDRVLRGGGYYNQPPFLRMAARGNAPPTTRDSGYGVRCARE